MQPSPSQRPSRVKKRRARRCISHLLKNCHQQKRERPSIWFVVGREGGSIDIVDGGCPSERAGWVFSAPPAVVPRSHIGHIFRFPSSFARCPLLLLPSCLPVPCIPYCLLPIHSAACLFLPFFRSLFLLDYIHSNTHSSIIITHVQCPIFCSRLTLRPPIISSHTEQVPLHLGLGASHMLSFPALAVSPPIRSLSKSDSVHGKPASKCASLDFKFITGLKLSPGGSA